MRRLSVVLSIPALQFILCAGVLFLARHFVDRDLVLGVWSLVCVWFGRAISTPTMQPSPLWDANTMFNMLTGKQPIEPPPMFNDMPGMGEDGPARTFSRNL